MIGNRLGLESSHPEGQNLVLDTYFTAFTVKSSTYAINAQNSKKKLHIYNNLLFFTHLNNTEEKMLVYYYSRINGRVKIRCTLWSPQLPPAELDKEIEDILKGVEDENSNRRN